MEEGDKSGVLVETLMKCKKLKKGKEKEAFCIEEAWRILMLL